MPPPLPPPLPTPRPKTWWDRNWLWIAILGGVALLALFGGGSIAGLHWISKQIKSSEGYRLAMKTVRADSRVQAALGEPIDDDADMLNGSFVNTGTIHTVIAQVPLKGPKGRGTVVLNAVQVNGPWQFETLSVSVSATRETIDLRAVANKPADKAGKP